MLFAVRTLIIGFTLTLAPYAFGAEQAAPAPAAQPADAPGCPGKADGAPCCATCQDKREAGVAAEKAEGGCPCQRARKARRAASAPAQPAQ